MCQTDGQTDRQTELLSQRPCNAERRTVKTRAKHTPTRAAVISGGCVQGGAEFAGQENDGQICRGWKMQDWKLTDKSIGLQPLKCKTRSADV